MADHVGGLLLPVVLNDHLVHIADGFHDHPPVGERIIGVLLFDHIEVVAGQTHDQIVTQRLCPAQQVDMTPVQNVKGAIGDDSFPHIHLIKNARPFAWCKN